MNFMNDSKHIAPTELKQNILFSYGYNTPKGQIKNIMFIEND